MIIVPEGTELTKETRRRILVVLAAIALGGIGIAVAVSSFTADPYTGSTDDAAAVCEDFVSDRLKAPSTAEFSNTVGMWERAGQYSVDGTVDSQNSFGAMIRTSYTCRVSYADGSWQLIGIKFLDQ